MQTNILKTNKSKLPLALVVAGLTILGAASTAHAQPGTGPVATACKEELAKHCADVPHVRGQARACLEKNKDKASDACRKALETTGPGRGMGKGMGRKMGNGTGSAPAQE